MTSTAQRLSFTTDCFVKWWKWNQHHHITSVVRTYTHTHRHGIYTDTLGWAAEGTRQILFYSAMTMYLLYVYMIYVRACVRDIQLWVFISYTPGRQCFVCVYVWIRDGIWNWFSTQLTPFLYMWVVAGVYIVQIPDREKIVQHWG